MIVQVGIFLFTGCKIKDYKGQQLHAPSYMKKSQ